MNFKNRVYKYHFDNNIILIDKINYKDLTIYFTMHEEKNI